ncbi:MAG TPA: hypothetical protein VGR71_03635 [Nitrospira sp.]|nr:hypothetical protein [Nitrospira sp.]HEV2336811.1 hypothetical protein [Stellaceae bacterium]
MIITVKNKRYKFTTCVRCNGTDISEAATGQQDVEHHVAIESRFIHPRRIEVFSSITVGLGTVEFVGSVPDSWEANFPTAELGKPVEDSRPVIVNGPAPGATAQSNAELGVIQVRVHTKLGILPNPESALIPFTVKR